MSVETESVDCPICGPSQQRPLYRKGAWSIVTCAECGLARVNPRRKNSVEIYQTDSYFSDVNYYYDYQGNKAAYQKGFTSKLALIRQHSARNGKLLDVGAAYGFFMEEAARFGFEPYGVELSREAAQHASQYGLVFQTPFLDVKTDHRFSAITFIDSLEHFEDPEGGLRKAFDLLDDGGLVAVMVPNIASWFARITGAKWHLLLPEEHLFYFTNDSLRRLLQKTGFQIVHLGTGGYGRSLAEILRVLSRGKSFSFNPLDRLLRKITFEINLGDIFAIARKIN